MAGSSYSGNGQKPLPVLLYTKTICENTPPVRRRLEELDIPFEEINVDQDEAAARFVEAVNHGLRATPTIVFGEREFIIVEPDLAELGQALRRAGYEA